ncbi:T9SS type A sorting domain-containing protein [Flavobacterium sp. N1994]|uniref:T9SS type A sorting domain-containing protein n=1 Tax=Flavobacterium sp. N1994 TaxID=2986827 RepID=UPI002222509B|nr:T9SS type A sorting domain-containing protein [Flavobacterium sp. N1994]
MKKILLTILITNSIISFSQTLDPTFGTNGGIVLNQFSTSNTDEWVTSAALQTDGNIIVVGRTADQFAANGFISRVFPTGSLDTSFNNYGYRSFSNVLEAVTIQSDGKILVAGGSYVTRLNSDGSFDSSFNSTGYIYLDSNGNSMTIKTLSMLSNGKIIATGYVSNGTDTDFAIIRLNSNGTIDTFFDLDGVTTLPLSGSNEILFATKIQTDGKIVVAGRRQVTTGTDYIISRFNTIGSLDTSFGTNGIVTSTTGIQSIDFQSDGKIVTAGNYTSPSNSSTSSSSISVSSSFLYAKRYNIDGSIDATFSVLKPSYRTNNVYQKPQVNCLSSGKILISGTYYDSITTNTQFALNQFNSDGTPDTSFSSTGTVYVGSSSFNADLKSLSSFLIVEPDGKILTGGTNFNKNTNSDFRMEFIQTSSTGVTEYIRDFNLKQGTDIINSAIEQPFGKTVVMVSSKNGYSSDTTLLIRYNQNGTIDNSFGTNGIVDCGFAYGYVMKQQLDGKILVSNDLTIYRYSSDGILDATFGGVNAGFITVLDESLNYSFVDDLIAANDGSIYVAFDNFNIDGSLLSFGVSKYYLDGTLDATYGVNGIATSRFDFYSATEYEYPRKLILNPDNSVIVTGPLYTTGNNLPPLANGMVKFNVSGLIDTTFGTNGKVITENNTYNNPREFLSDSNSNLYLVSDISTGSLITKFLPNGTIDTTYGTNGLVTDTFYNAIMQPNGKIVKAGAINSQFGITRYNTNGTLDATFGTAGILSTPIYYSSGINKLLYLSSNKLLAVGRSFNGSNTIMAMTRYTNLNLGTLDFTTKDTNFMVYPNPIEESATFSYSLKDAAIVTIEIIDLQGKVVQSVLNSKEQQSGEYQQEILLPSTVATGNYIVRFSSPQGNQAVKIIKK